MANLVLPPEINLVAPLDGRHRSQPFEVRGFLVHAMGKVIAIGDGIGAHEFLKQKKLSAHYLIDTGGTAIQMVSTDSGANHAGTSEFKGLTSLNNWFLGAELLVEGTHTLASLYQAMRGNPYSDAQIDTLAAIITAAKRAYGFGNDMVTGHRSVTYIRKTAEKDEQKRDPGPQVIRDDDTFSEQFQNALDEWDGKL